MPQPTYTSRVLRTIAAFVCGIVIGGVATGWFMLKRTERAVPQSVIEPVVTAETAPAISEEQRLAASVGMDVAPSPLTDTNPGEAAAKPVPALARPATLPADALVIPVAGVKRDALRDDFAELRGGTRAHEALDIAAPRATPVLAAVDGTVAKLFLSKPGGITLYEFDPTKQWIYYYAHLDGYADGIAEGQTLHRGDVIGFVGTTGNAPPNAPHLHFAISKAETPGRWWKSQPIDPFPLLTSRGVTIDVAK